MVVKAFVEHLSGVIRVGSEAAKYGDPFDYAVTYSSVDGKNAVVKALVGDSNFSIRHARAIIKALREIGLKAVWERRR